MNSIKLQAFAFLAVSLLGVGAFADSVPVPHLKGRVTDLTGTLSASQCQQLEGSLQQFEAAKGSQVVVLIVPSTRPETIEQYGIRVADQWKIGRRGVNDGVILLVAKNDHTLRIEVGRGFEGALTDATASRIINEIIVPFFKRGDFFGGIEAGVGRIIKVIQGEPLPTPARSAPANRHNIDSYFIYLFLGVPLVMSAIGAIIGRLLAGITGGGIMGVATYWMTGEWVAGVLFGLFFFVFCALAASSNMRRHGGGSWSSGGWSSGSSGGGGFSGGGGSFGGGGASGSW